MGFGQLISTTFLSLALFLCFEKSLQCAFLRFSSAITYSIKLFAETEKKTQAKEMRTKMKHERIAVSMRIFAELHP